VSTIHASAVLVGPKAALIRGPSGSGKSQLVWDLIQAAGSGVLPFVRLVADDRAHVEAAAGRLLVRPAEALYGMLELRGLGIRRLPYEPLAVVGFVVDLATAGAERLPAAEARIASLQGVTLPRLTVAPDAAALTMMTAFLGGVPAAD
jgi:serine kinase of HPr protein (carbohydrate metabolism regulator)